MLRIAVCDDIPCYMEELADLIGSWSDARGIHVQLKKFVSGEELLFDWECTGDFAAVFMDVKLSGMDGTETALRVREQSETVSIVFVSHYERYFNQMFGIYPHQYIKKPVSRQRIYKALDRIAQDHKVTYESFAFRYNQSTFNISLREVLYFASEKRKIKIYLKSGREYVFYEKLNVLEEVFANCSNRFIRIHQSYLVNDRHVEEFHPRYVVMRNGEMLPVSRQRRAAVGKYCIELSGIMVGEC